MPRRTALNVVAVLCLGIISVCLVLTLSFWLLRLR